MWFLIVLTSASFVLALFMVESAPTVRHKRGLHPLIA